jgi:hypothetical protein
MKGETERLDDYGINQPFSLAKVYFFGIEGIPIFPGQAVNFECLSAPVSFKFDCFSWKYRYCFNLEKVEPKVSNRLIIDRRMPTRLFVRRYVSNLDDPRPFRLNAELFRSVSALEDPPERQA